MSLVTNEAVTVEPPRGDDPLIQGASPEELEKILKQGRANHEEVIHEGRLAAVHFQVSASCRKVTLADGCQNLVTQLLDDLFHIRP